MASMVFHQPFVTKEPVNVYCLCRTLLFKLWCSFCITLYQGFLRHFNDPIRVPRIRENRVPRNSEIGSLQAGPALASAGPDWKHFCGDPLRDVCINLREHYIDLRFGRDCPGLNVCPVPVSKMSRNFTSVKFSKWTPAWWCIVMK